MHLVDHVDKSPVRYHWSMNHDSTCQPVSDDRCLSKEMCIQGKQTDRQTIRQIETVEKKNQRMSAETSDAMLRTRFVCYLYSFSPYRSSSTKTTTSMMMMMMGIPRCKRMAGGWYSTFGTHERSCWYGCILPCSDDDDDATEMKRVLRGGGTFTMRRERKRERARRREEKAQKKNINISTLLSHQSPDVFILFCSPLIGARTAARKKKREKREKTKPSYFASISFAVSLSLSLHDSHAHLSYQP